MRKEIIVVIIIIILIIIGHIITQNYTANFFDELSIELDEIDNKLNSKEVEDSNLKSEMEEIEKKWKSKYNVLAYYIEHDELEKVETQLVLINSAIMINDYDNSIEELEKCKFMLEHIKDKDSLKLVNIF